MGNSPDFGVFPKVYFLKKVYFSEKATQKKKTHTIEKKRKNNIIKRRRQRGEKITVLSIRTRTTHQV